MNLKFYKFGTCPRCNVDKLFLYSIGHAESTKWIYWCIMCIEVEPVVVPT